MHYSHALLFNEHACIVHSRIKVTKGGYKVLENSTHTIVEGVIMIMIMITPLKFCVIMIMIMIIHL